MRICAFADCTADLDALGLKATARYCCTGHRVAAYKARSRSVNGHPAQPRAVTWDDRREQRRRNRYVTRCPRCGFPMERGS